ncbi:MAG: fatty acid desaturase [Planctomycetes bacterium]|jgi:stearoyl-CoA desaturase (delta-9 desaturase)|nr:fatty acid desaturase [Planctomycetota bacterium]
MTELATEPVLAPEPTSPPMRGRGVDRVLAAIVTFVPPLGALLAAWLWWHGRPPGWPELVAMLGMHAIALVGVEVGFHRLFAHRSFEPCRAVKIALAVTGSMAFQGPVIWWASIHRKHHQFSDQAGDPHSMYLGGEGRLARLRGALHAHLGWIWSADSVGRGGFARYAKDLYRDADVLAIHMHYLRWLLLGMAAPALFVGLCHGSFEGALLGLLWGGLVRVFVMNHLTYWCINSVTHAVGRRPYRTTDRSTNFALLCIPTLGQSWHNNHHADQVSALMNHHWWQLDLGGLLLRLLERCRLVRNVRRPNRARLAALAAGATPRSRTVPPATSTSSSTTSEP